jgi:hypothetical protein
MRQRRVRRFLLATVTLEFLKISSEGTLDNNANDDAAINAALLRSKERHKRWKVYPSAQGKSARFGRFTRLK